MDRKIAIPVLPYPTPDMMFRKSDSRLDVLDPLHRDHDLLELLECAIHMAISEVRKENLTPVLILVGVRWWLTIEATSAMPSRAFDMSEWTDLRVPGLRGTRRPMFEGIPMFVDHRTKGVRVITSDETRLWTTRCYEHDDCAQSRELACACRKERIEKGET